VRAIGAYAVERFPWRLFAPAIAIHAGLAWWAAGAHALALPASLGLTALLFALFRLWDDLEDVRRDAMTNPRRVLVRSDRSPFRMLLVLLTIAAAVLFAHSVAAAAAFSSLLAAFWVAYRLLRSRLSDPAWRFGVLLLKYPAFVVLVGNAVGSLTPTRAAAATLCSYLTASAYEAWHHDRGHVAHVRLAGSRLPGRGASR
jgi:hypothetical protein